LNHYPALNEIILVKIFIVLNWNIKVLIIVENIIDGGEVNLSERLLITPNITWKYVSCAKSSCSFEEESKIKYLGLKFFLKIE